METGVRDPRKVLPATTGGAARRTTTQVGIIHRDGALQRFAMARISFLWSNLKRGDLP